MKRMRTLLATGLLFTAGSHAVLTNGVTPGEFTMDLDAAKTYAAEQKLPLLVNFSGSDWCGWCQLMDSNIFSTDEWKSYAGSNVVMVLIDFPQDKTLVPAAFKERNEKLQVRFGVEGFPTFIVLDDDGETELGRLTAGQEKTPDSFRAELDALFQNRPAVMAVFAENLKPEERAQFEKMTAALTLKQDAMKTIWVQVEDLGAQADVLNEEILVLEAELKEFRIGQQGEDTLKQYQVLKTEFDKKESELLAWLETAPEENEENTAKFEALRNELIELNTKMDSF